MSATITFEVECEVTGSIQPAETDVGIMSSYVEDATVEGLSALIAKRVDGKFAWTPKDILAGLDQASRDIVLSNINALFADEISDAVMQEGAE